MGALAFCQECAELRIDVTPRARGLPGHPCGDGLICCPSDPGMPGGAGVCDTEDDGNAAPPAPGASAGCECDYHALNCCDPDLQGCCAREGTLVCC